MESEETVPQHVPTDMESALLDIHTSVRNMIDDADIDRKIESLSDLAGVLPEVKTGSPNSLLVTQELEDLLHLSRVPFRHIHPSSWPKSARHKLARTLSMVQALYSGIR